MKCKSKIAHKTYNTLIDKQIKKCECLANLRPSEQLFANTRNMKRRFVKKNQMSYQDDGKLLSSQDASFCGFERLRFILKSSFNIF